MHKREGIKPRNEQSAVDADLLSIREGTIKGTYSQVVYLQPADNSLARKTGSIPPFDRHRKGIPWYAPHFSTSFCSSRCSGSWCSRIGCTREGRHRNTRGLSGPQDHHKPPSPSPA